VGDRMSNRQNTIVCAFDPRSPRISAYGSHEWIYDNLHFPENEVTMVQIDGTRRSVCIKFADFNRMQ
jgi:hypothetical protein